MAEVVETPGVDAEVFSIRVKIISGESHCCPKQIGRSF
jgi:hypothetical protein